MPQLKDLKVVGQGEHTTQYLLEWSEQNSAVNDIDYFEVSVSGNNNKTKSFVSAQDNNVIISCNVGVESHISVVGVNKCGQRSTPGEKTLKPMNPTPLKENRFVIYLVTALAITFCLISLLLLIVIFMCVFQKLRMNKVKLSITTCNL